MPDKRLKNYELFDRRQQEWNLDVLKTTISDLFENINVLDNWKFVKISWVKNTKKRREELKKHIYRTIKIQINELTQKQTVKKEHVYNIQIPELLQGQFFYIGGLLKVPIFQIYDDPIVYRVVKNKSSLLQFKSNVISIKTNINKDDAFLVNIKLNHMKLEKNIPYENIITALYTKEIFHNFVDTLVNENDVITKLVERCDELWDKYSEDELIEKLGKYRVSNVAVTDSYKKGNSILFALRNAIKVDMYTKKFMKTDCPILEILYALDEGPRSDTDLANKRLRFSEYILSNLVNSVFDMICILNDNKRVKFKIASTILIDACNVSSVVHHNFPYNPIGEIASLVQGSLIGPDSFNKDNIPSHLKNIDESHYGIVCPADTPDREGCGVILNLCTNANINEDGKLSHDNNEIICSYPISLVPFMSNDDQTRLQMASGQMKQSILLDKASKPFVKSGAESKFFEYSSFKQIAKDSGEIIYKSDKFIIAKYDNEEVEIFKLSYRPMYLNCADHMYSNLKEGQRFKKGATIVTSKFFQDDEITLGHNLLTGVAIWNGYNYEDGIVISESITEKYTSIHTVELQLDIEGGQILLSLLDDKYKPLPEIGDVLKKGDVYAKLKHIGHDGIESINIESKNFNAPIDCEITDIQIFPNSWNKQITQFDHFIKSLILNQNKNLDEIQNQLAKYMSTEEIDNIMNFYELSKLRVTDKPPPDNSSKYSEKGRNIDGVRIIIKAIHKSAIKVGDKVSNRHGSKGIIAQIVPEEQMPKLEDGRRLEIIVNPLGIISRMNVGQLFELHSTESLYQLKQMLYRSYEKFGELSETALSKLEKYFDILDVTNDKWTSKETINKFYKTYKKDPVKAIEELQIIQPPFESIHPTDLERVMKFTKASYRQMVYDNNDDPYFDNEISVGYNYYNKLIHRSEEKLISRSVGPYVNSTLQPVGGKKNHGGHRLGEMELWAISAQGAEVTLEELLTTHSDSPGKKLKVLSEILENNEILLENDAPDKPRTLSVLNAMFKTIGVEIKE